MSNEEEETQEETGPIEFTGNIEDVMDRVLPKDGKALRAGPIFEPQTLKFGMSSNTCNPGFFEGPSGEETEFKLTVVALSHQQEIEATRSVKAPTDLPFALAKRSLIKFNDKKLTDKRRDFLWEAVGPKGRQVILTGYTEINSAGDEALGKLHSEWEV